MYGVVLWSDTEDKKAVIWCEDHGDLAFYSGDEDQNLEYLGFDAGDLVQFDLTQARHMRLAQNPRLVAEDQYPNLADSLKSADALPTSPRKLGTSQRDGSDKIIPFAARRSARGTSKDMRQQTAF